LPGRETAPGFLFDRSDRMAGIRRCGDGRPRGGSACANRKRALRERRDRLAGWDARFPVSGLYFQGAIGPSAQAAASANRKRALRSDSDSQGRPYAIRAMTVRIDPHCYLRGIAARVLVFAGEILPANCKSLFFTMSPVDFAGEFRREGAKNNGGPQVAPASASLAAGTAHTYDHCPRHASWLAGIGDREVTRCPIMNRIRRSRRSSRSLRASSGSRTGSRALLT
jgi:hypothetical protein